MSLLLDASHRLIDGFCRPDETGYPFINMFGPYTPCFVNTGLGVFHTLAILAIAMHLHRLLASPAYSKYRLTRAFLPWAAVCTAALCVLLPLFELNGKLGEARGGDQPTPAPYEYLDPLLACLTWTSFACMLYTEANGRYVYEGRTLVRVGIILAFSAELAKTRILWAMWDDLVKHDYFFFLHLSYVGMQSILGLMALCWWPEKGDQVLEHEGYMPEKCDQVLEHEGYMPIPDGSEDLHNNVSPEATAGIWSSFLFTWMTPLISAGYRAPLTKEQIWKLRPHDRVDYVSEKFRRHWAEECAQPGPRGGASLFRACLNTVSHLFVTAIPWKLLCDASQFVGPLFLNLLLKLLSDPDAPVWLGYAYAGVMFAGTLVGVLADNQHFVRTTRAGLRLKAMLSAVVYDKVFSLTPASRANFTSGRIFNLISSDSETLSMLSVNCMAIISSPVRIIVAVYFLWLQLGVAAFVSVVFLLAMIPLNLVLVSWSAFLLKTALGHTDERTKLEGELMGGMEVVKCSSWESPFLADQNIAAARQKELDVLLKVSLLQAVVLFILLAVPTIVPVATFGAYLYLGHDLSAAEAFTALAVVLFILFAVPTIVPVATFGAYLYLGHDLSAAEAFTALALFNVLRFPLFVLPQIIQLWTNARVSVTRLQEFLSSEDLEETPPTPAAKPGETAISVQGDFAWEINRPPILTDVNLEVPAGSLVVVVGSTGSGKSSLLASMLGCQMPPVNGSSPKLRGKAAFIINATVRDNILFGLPYDAERYQAAVVASCLDSDFLLLPGGDLTELVVASCLDSNFLLLPGGDMTELVVASCLDSDFLLLPGGDLTELVVASCLDSDFLLLPGGVLTELGEFFVGVGVGVGDSDFLLLPGGDLTELGDRGVNVSGGQRQRLSIARAIYSEADVLLFDDPLSALDSKVGKRVFDQVIRGALADKTVVLATYQLNFVQDSDLIQSMGALADKTVVLATNQLNFVQASDLILFMSQPGGILERGSFNELTAQGGAFVTMMQEVQLEGDEEVAPVSTEESESSLKGVDKGEAEVEGKAAPSSPSPSSPPPEPAAPARQVAKPGPIVAAATTNKVAKLTEQESASEGSVSPAVIRDYINSLGGTWWFVYLLITFIVTEGGRVLTNLWLAVWTGDEAGERSPYFYLCVYAGISVSQCILQLGNAIETARFGLSGCVYAGISVSQCILQLGNAIETARFGLSGCVYAGISVSQCILQLGNAIETARFGLSGAGKLHESMLQSLLKAPIMQLLSTLVLMGVLAPMGLPPLTIIMVVFAMLFNYYQASVRQLKRLEAVSRSPVFSSILRSIPLHASVRQLKRLEAVSRSPVFSSLNEAIAGVATIRAFGMTNQLSEQHGRMVDFNCSTNLMSNNLTRWLSVRLESLGATATLMVAVVAVEQRGKASNMGLVLLYAMQVTVLMSITLRVGSITETLFNSVERVSEYTRLPLEEPERNADMEFNSVERVSEYTRLPLEEPERDADMEARLLKPPTGWPTEGTVEFKTVTMRYRPGLPLVIRGISFRAESKDKIGEVGRTGAGKSSMIGCLLTEVESGIIEIDGLNISKMSLNALRSKLSLIPQVAVLFTGTIRLNLSPFGLHSEAELWAALRRAHLHAVVESWPAGLDAHLQEGGAPLSAGQKQLLALARALLNPSKVLVLDEATANVDVETDSLIQQTLRSAFANRTMITIAHRLHTVIDYTKVLVLNQGMVGEFMTPATLLANNKSLFFSMVDNTGDSTSDLVLVLHQGMVGEFGTLATLLANDKSLFFSMVDDTGDSASDQIVLVLHQGMVGEFGTLATLLANDKSLFFSMVDDTGDSASDQIVLVLHQGMVGEFGTLATLLANDKSLFFSMVDDTGDSASDQIVSPHSSTRRCWCSIRAWSESLGTLATLLANDKSLFFSMVDDTGDSASDQIVLVLHQGMVGEFGTLATLLANDKSLFFSMVDEIGDSASDQIVSPHSSTRRCWCSIRAWSESLGAQPPS
eukprot:gene22904-30080_t